MSSLIGAPGERWPLSRAIDALGDAARQTSKPGLVWLLGLFYPGLDLIAVTGGAILLGVLMRPDIAQLDAVGAVLANLLFFQVLLVPRISAGLALAGPAETWTDLCQNRSTPRLRDVWRIGRGLGWATLGLWFHLVLMLVVQFVVLVLAPHSVLRHFGLNALENQVPGAILLGPFITIFLGCSFVLSVLYQLGLQSLVQNRRGVGSALLHAWRIARYDPWATARAVLVDYVAVIAALVVQGLAIAAAVLWIPALCCFAPFVLLLALFRLHWVTRGSRIFYGLLLLMIPGLIGVVRAAYWARVYRALGGLAPVDGVPGLPSGVLRETPTSS